MMIICPSCGADMHFSPSTQQLVCGYCDTTLSPEKYAESEGLLSQDSEFYETTIFTCPQCGGEIMNTEETAATFCSYCGASVQLASRIGQEKRPKKIIPFSIDVDSCKESYIKRIKSAIFAPKYLRNNSEIEKFRGIYMPYWSYDLSCNQSLKESGETSSRKGDYIITKHYTLGADVEGSYEGIAYDSASNFDDEISAAISPFDAKQAKPFNPAYMSGFYADRGDVAADIYQADAEKLCMSDVARRFAGQEEFDGISVDSDKIEKHVAMTDVKQSFVLYPVWFLTNHYGKDRVTYAVVNGQTGKVAADIPIDPLKYILASLIVAVPVFFILNLLPAIEPSKMILITMILHVICTVISMCMSYYIYTRDSRSDDRGYGSTHSEKENESAEKFDIKQYIYHLVLLVVAFILFIMKFNSDFVYYACSSVVMLGVAATFVGIIKRYNTLSTHKPPQLGKRGGDENA